MTVLLAFVAVALVLFYIYRLARSVDLGLTSLLAVELYNMTFGVNSGLVGGLHISPVDIVSICLLAAGVIRTAQRIRNLNSARLLALGYLAILAVSILRGFFANGVITTSNESRGFVAPLAAMLYFLTAPTDEESTRKYIRVYLYFGAALCAVAALAAVGLPVGMGAEGHLEAASVNGRFLVASAAGAIGVCGILSLSVLQYRERGLLNQLLPIMYLCVAIYLRHRTVWVMLLAGTVALIPIDRSLFRRLVPYALLTAFTIGVLLFFGGEAGQLVGTDKFSSSATDTQTWEWRVAGWKSLVLDEEQTALTVIIGKSMGDGYWRIDPVSHEAIVAAPHSEYVQEYLRVGVVGMFLLLFLWVRSLAKLWKFTSQDRTAVYPSTSAWAIVVFMMLAYGVTYSIDAHSYALLGLAAATASGLVDIEGESTRIRYDGYEVVVASSVND